MEAMRASEHMVWLANNLVADQGILYVPEKKLLRFVTANL